MGFNPHRTYRRKPADYLFVGLAFLAAIGLVVWAFAG
jgi:hypothetical protein